MSMANLYQSNLQQFASARERTASLVADLPQEAFDFPRSILTVVFVETRGNRLQIGGFERRRERHVRHQDQEVGTASTPAECEGAA